MSKRPHDNGMDGSAAKKARNDTTPSSSSKSATGLSTDEIIKQKRAEIQAKLAALSGKTVVPSPVSTPSLLHSIPPKPSATPPANNEIAKRIEEAKKKIADLKSKVVVEDNPYLAVAQASKKKMPIAEPTPQGAGLKMAAHPLLLDTSTPAPQSKKDKYKPMMPKFASIKANIRNTPTSTPPPAVPSPIPATEVKTNPYAAKDAASGSFEGAAPKERSSRSFRFNQKGKYVQIGNQARQEAKLEELKQRIAETARKAGLDSEFETLEKNIRREAPPDAEWWDVPLLPSKSYGDLTEGLAALNIRNDSSPITLYVQHPIPIPAPGEKDAAPLKPLMLTKAEQKKMRKQRRQAELQDRRDRIKIGIMPPDPPKVRVANLMKVLTSDAVQDPTRMEARVRREVAMRRHTHEKMNAERKLNDEQRREKRDAKKLEEERRGLVGAVFRVRTLADLAHRFKVRKNAEQNSLTGVCIYHPSFSMVYVEGAAKYMRQYEKLMLRRIKWTEAARSRGEDDVELEGNSQAGDDEAAGSGIAASSSTKAANTGEDGEFGTANLEDNRCDLVWKGELRERAFKTFKPKTCPTDAAAKEVLGPKMAGFWDTTKNWKAEEVELF